MAKKINILKIDNAETFYVTDKTLNYKGFLIFNRSKKRSELIAKINNRSINLKELYKEYNSIIKKYKDIFIKNRDEIIKQSKLGICTEYTANGFLARMSKYEKGLESALNLVKYYYENILQPYAQEGKKTIKEIDTAMIAIDQRIKKFDEEEDKQISWLNDKLDNINKSISERRSIKKEPEENLKNAQQKIEQQKIAEQKNKKIHQSIGLPTAYAVIHNFILY